MKTYTITEIQKLCDTKQSTIDNIIWKSVNANLENMKLGLQKMFALFKMKRTDNAIYLMFVNVNRKDENNVHCDIISVTRYENATEYNRHVELSK